jgi:xanthine dehydrogenase small subunit
MLQFILNHESIETDLPRGTTVLDFVRYHRHLPGTKIGCREGDCGACTVLVGELNGEAVTYRNMTSCLLPLTNVRGKHVVTVEGINPPDPSSMTPVQQALVDESGTQCGFCTVGFVMSLTGFCLEHAVASVPEEDAYTQAIAAIDGNICRCTGYKSIERAAARLTHFLSARNGLPALEFAVQAGIVPAYFSSIKSRLAALLDARKAAMLNTQTLKHSNTQTLLGGCTDLYVQRPEDMAHAPTLPLFDAPSLRGIRTDGDQVEIGGACTVSDLLQSPVMRDLFPELEKYVRLVSSTPIRNMATLAGNLVNASPIGDLTSWFLALDASVVLANGTRREIPLREFYLGYKKLAKTADEVLETVRFKKPAGRYFFNFEKVSKRTYLDIATVNTAIFLRLENDVIQEAQVSAGGVAPVPLYLKKTSEFLIGKSVRDYEGFLPEANEIIQSEISPISDVRGSAEYKRLLLSRLFTAHFMEINSKIMNR